MDIISSPVFAANTQTTAVAQVAPKNQLETERNLFEQLLQKWPR